MGIFEHNPYTNFHNLNLDWILAKMKEYGSVIDGLDKVINDAIDKKLDDLDLMTLILNAMTEYGLVINVKAPPNNLPPASGDGSQDDTITIQGCIDYANTHGGKAVFFPSGAYLTKSLDMKSNVSLISFDTSTTKIVLRGGATRALLNGNVENITIENITLDGNMDIQVNNVDLIDLTGKDIVLHNVVLLDGYNLLKINVTGYVKGSLVTFKGAVIDSLQLTGFGDVQFDNIIFTDLSDLHGRNIIRNSVDNAVFSNIYSKAFCTNAIYNTGNKCAFIGRLLNATNTISNTGSDLYTNFYERGGTGSQDLLAEIQNRIDADNMLRGELDTEIINRINADDSLNDSLVAEIQDRIDADNMIGDSLNMEMQDRIDADNILQDNINSEMQDRIDADNILQHNIDTLSQVINNSETYVNIKTFGAIGDGQTDDTISIHNALNFAFNGGNRKMLYIPAGIYKVSQINNVGSISIIGDGENSVLLGSDNSKSILLFPNDLTGVRLHNFKLSRSVIPTVNSGGHGIVCANSGYDFIFTNLHIVNQEDGIQILGNTAGAWIDKCFVENCSGNGYRIDMPNMTISQCHANNIGKHGYTFKQSNGLYLIRCESYRCKGNGFNLQPEGVNAINDVIISNCTASTCTTCGIYVDTNGHNIKINSCFIEYTGFNDEGGGAVQLAHGVYVTSRNGNVDIDVQSIWNSGNGLRIDCDSFKVSGSYMANNLFTGGFAYGIYAPNSPKNFIITGATCGSAGSLQNTQEFGLVIEGTPTDFIISDCNFTSNLLGSISCPNSSGGRITNCIGYNPRGLIQPTPSIPLSSVPFTNTFNTTCQVHIDGVDITNVSINGIGLIGDMTGPFTLGVGDTITFTYDTSLNWIWFGL